MAIFFIEGFDKYGPALTTNPGQGSYTDRLAAHMAGEWSTLDFSTSGSAWIDQPLSSTGGSLALASGIANLRAKKALANLARSIGGVRCKLSALTTGNLAGVRFLEGSNNQAGVFVNTSGNIIVVNSAGTTVATGATPITAGAPFYLEWDITFGDTGAYSVYLDGILLVTGTADFKASTNAYATDISFGWHTATAAGEKLYFDDIYLDDGTGSALLTSPVVETALMSSDASPSDFGNSSAIFGVWEMTNSGTSASVAANRLTLRKFTPSVSGSLASVSFLPSTTAAAVKVKAVVYADSAGSPGTLLATGVEVVGTGTVTSTTVVTSTFSSPPSLTGGTAYWIGFINDTAVSVRTADSSSLAFGAANTYTSGAPGSPTVTGTSSYLVFGALTGVSGNDTYDMVQQPSFSLGDFNYVSSSSVNDEELFNVAGMTSNPSAIYTVALKGVFKNSDAGARTVTFQTKSSTTDSNSTAVAPTTTYRWYSGYWPLDPNGNTAWTKTNVNNALSGFKIAT